MSRKINKKEFAHEVEVSYPTLNKLITEYEKGEREDGR